MQHISSRFLGRIFLCRTVYWSQIMIEMRCYLLKCKYWQSKFIKEQGLTMNFNEKNEKPAFGLFIFLHFSHVTKTWIPISSTPDSSSDVDLQRACFYQACLWGPPLRPTTRILSNLFSSWFFRKLLQFSVLRGDFCLSLRWLCFKNYT